MELYSLSGVTIKEQWLGLLDLWPELLAPLDHYARMTVS